MKIEDLQLVKRIIEGALMAADNPLSRRAIKELFDELERPEDALLDQAINELQADTDERGYELTRVASGYRYQVKQELSRWVGKLWKERAPRYSRALLETLSLIAYRQPITRGEIEDIRGVAVSTQIIKTLLEREWVKIVGHRDVPGRPAIYATTKMFLDYFNLSSLDQLPPLAEIRDLNTISREFNIEMPEELKALEAEDDQSPDEGAGDNIAEASAANEQPEPADGLATLETWLEDELDESAKNDPAAETAPTDSDSEYQEDEAGHLMQAAPDSSRSMDC